MRRGKTRGTGVRGQYNVIYGYVDEQVGLAAGHARRPAGQPPRAAPTRSSTSTPSWSAFLLQAERTAFGPSTQAILDEAVSRDIPWLRLNEHSLVQLGQGVHQQRIRATMTSKTAALAVDIAGDKELTTRLLAAAGLPVPRSESVRTAEQAVRGRATGSATPSCASRWTATTAAASCSTSRTTTSCATAFPIAEEESRRGWVVVESFITGKDYRVLVIGGRMVALAERVPAHVVGDGVRTGARAGRRDQRRPASRRRPREGADPHQGRRRRGRRSSASRASAMDDVPPDGHDGQAHPDRQHVDRRHLDRPHARGAPGQRRDRRGGRPRRRARRRRHRLHLPRHRRAGPRDRRRDLRGQRGARVPDAHPPDRSATRSSSPSRSSTRCSRPARPAGSRSSR